MTETGMIIYSSSWIADIKYLTCSQASFSFLATESLLMCK